METTKSAFKFDGYLVKHSDITITNEPSESEALKVEIVPKGIKQRNNFTLILKVSVCNDDKSIEINMEVHAFFSFKDETSGIGGYFTTNAPALVFPYIRGYISLLTSISGSGTITLPTLNLTSVGNELKENIEDIAH